MNPMFRITAGSLLMLVLGAGCNNSNKNSSSSASTFSCSFKKDGELALCTQYQELTGSTLTSIQSECELRSSEGYSWAVAACPASTIGSCSLAASAQKAAPSTQFYYGSTFGSAGTAEGMCQAKDGTFKE
jgi:hypothetical protein